MLGKGAYTIAEAARILQSDPQKIRRWVLGNTFTSHGRRRFSEPLIQTAEGNQGEEPFLTFQNLIELLFISLFRKEGVTIPTIRAAASAATRQFNTNHPFAVKKFETDGTRIFATLKEASVEDVPRAQLVADLSASQMVIEQVARRFFRNLEYRDQHDVLRYWPLGKDKSVVLDPSRSFGKPIDKNSGVPTYVLYAMARKGASPKEVSLWYRVEEEAVRDAIDYESSLLKAA